VSNAHGESLLPLVEVTLKNGRCAIGEIDLFAVGIGPGSFTGTRVGVATAKGLALGARKPLRGVEGFDALAAHARAPSGVEVAVAIDARKGEVYLAVCRIEELDVLRIVEPIHAAPNEAWARIGRSQIPGHFAGDGIALVPELAARAPLRIGIESPSAIAIAALAGARQHRESIDELDVPEPLYVRPPDVTMPKTPPGMPHRGSSIVTIDRPRAGSLSRK